MSIEGAGPETLEEAIPKFVKFKARGKAARAGDVFCVRFETGHHVVGRVIRVGDAINAGPGFWNLLVYFYTPVLAAVPSVEDVAVGYDTQHLLLPPLFMFPQVFTAGFATVIASQELKPSDRLAQHCFWDWAMAKKDVFVDEDGRKLSGRIEPCGDFSVSARGALEFKIWRAIQGVGRGAHG